MCTLLRKAPFRAGAAVLAAGTAALLAVPAGVAHADPATCGGTVNFDVVQFQVDNCPGNGAASWAWLWAPKASTAASSLLSATLYLTFGNGGTVKFTINPNSSFSESFWNSGDNIKKAQVCELWFIFFPRSETLWVCSSVRSF
jgi:hypothetical protein